MPELYTRDGVHYCTIYVVLDSGKRKRIQLSTGVKDDGSASSRAAARTNAAQLERTRAAAGGRKARGTSLPKAYAARAAKIQLKGGARASLKILAQKMVHPLRYFAGRDCESLTEEDLQSYAAHAREMRAVATVDRELTELRAAMKAVGVVPPKRPELGRARVVERWLDEAQTKRLLAHAAQVGLHPRAVSKVDHIIVYRYLGLTWSELYKIERVDWRRNEVRVKGTKRQTRDRVLPMPRIVREVLLRRLGPKGRGFEMWANANGNQDLTDWGRACGVILPGERLSFNDLRRSFCTELIAKGQSTKLVSELMGHTNEAMVNRIYARVATGAHMHEVMAHLHDPTD